MLQQQQSRWSPEQLPGEAACPTSLVHGSDCCALPVTCCAACRLLQCIALRVACDVARHAPSCTAYCWGVPILVRHTVSHRGALHAVVPPAPSRVAPHVLLAVFAWCRVSLLRPHALQPGVVHPICCVLHCRVARRTVPCHALVPPYRLPPLRKAPVTPPGMCLGNYSPDRTRGHGRELGEAQAEGGPRPWSPGMGRRGHPGSLRTGSGAGGS